MLQQCSRKGTTIFPAFFIHQSFFSKGIGAGGATVDAGDNLGIHGRDFILIKLMDAAFLPELRDNTGKCSTLP